MESVVRVRGLPAQARELEFAAALSPHPLRGNSAAAAVRLLLDPASGRPTGEALVDLATPADAAGALARLPFASPATRAEFDDAISPAAAAGGCERGVLRMRGLPFDASVEDVEAFFDGFPLLSARDGGVHLLPTIDGRPSGEGFAEFATPSDAAAAHAARNRARIRNRYIELFVSSRAELSMQLQRIAAGRLAFAPAQPLSSLSSSSLELGASRADFVCVRMRGLPFQATVADIAGFFAGFELAQDGIKILMNAAGRPSGDGYAEFASLGDATRAQATLNGKHLLNRFIELFPASRQEMRNAVGSIGRPSGRHRPPQQQQQQLMQPRFQQQQHAAAATATATVAAYSAMMGLGIAQPVVMPQNCIVHVKGIPFSTTAADVEAFFCGFQFLPGSTQLGILPDGRASGDAWIAFLTPNEAHRAIFERNHQYLGNRWVTLSFT